MKTFLFIMKDEKIRIECLLKYIKRAYRKDNIQ